MTATFAAVLAAMMIAHHVADHWFQTGAQALGKAGRDWPGRLACARHAAVVTATLAAALGAVAAVTGMRLSIPVTAAALLLNGATHWWADRRHTLAALANRIGKGPFWVLGAPRPGHDDQPCLGTGQYALDQSWHLLWLLITALLITAGSPS